MRHSRADLDSFKLRLAVCDLNPQRADPSRVLKHPSSRLVYSNERSGQAGLPPGIGNSRAFRLGRKEPLASATSKPVNC
jgi:hypothetical protein